ncbi:hypothetical protein BWGOE4_29110 [Bacillus mycoides]|nr:hypothetical protein BWGOE2_28700 [Bacillus mycoides]OFD44267.1 hypothetical protein BWGOE1_31490 [Bacillus mycoides]OFD45469.1 hypothetical protein BWGOE3_31220 [Bacillus mycoides]OFD58108.1 hypothetical protein BWGOE4_29110 [Bacillus mycoides]OFD58792.1 hypothetical protein BWGOE6_31000 [Bacillus mycoides]
MINLFYKNLRNPKLKPHILIKLFQSVWVSSIYKINICSNTLIKLQFKPILTTLKSSFYQKLKSLLQVDRKIKNPCGTSSVSHLTEL